MGGGSGVFKTVSLNRSVEGGGGGVKSSCIVQDFTRTGLPLKKVLAIAVLSDTLVDFLDHGYTKFFVQIDL